MEKKLTRTYFYVVSELVTTFGKDKKQSDPISHEEEFKGDLKKARLAANEYYNERLDGFNSENASYHLPFEGAKDFKYGEHAAFSLDIYLVEDIKGNPPEEMSEMIDILEESMSGGLINIPGTHHYDLTDAGGYDEMCENLSYEREVWRYNYGSDDAWREVFE